MTWKITLSLRLIGLMLLISNLEFLKLSLSFISTCAVTNKQCVDSAYPYLFDLVLRNARHVFFPDMTDRFSPPWSKQLASILIFIDLVCAEGSCNCTQRISVNMQLWRRRTNSCSLSLEQQRLHGLPALCFFCARDLLSSDGVSNITNPPVGSLCCKMTNKHVAV
jgi:hypothetical protein